MVELVSTEKKSFQMESSEPLIELCKPVRHSIVVSILRLIREFLNQLVRASEPWDRPNYSSPVGPDFPQGRITIGNDSKASLFTRVTIQRRLIGHRHELIIEIRHPQRDLRPFHHELRAH